jgi:neutral ceramidase
MRIFLLSLLFSAAMMAADAPKPALQAGAATSNITPEIGGPIVGGFTPAPSTHIHDELHARCLVLDDGKAKVALVVCDLLGIHRSVSLEARRLIEESTGIPPSHVLISCTHTHSATNAMGTTPRSYSSEMELSEYQRFVARRIADGVKRAVNNLRPAQIGFGTVDVPEHVHNRRWFMKEGTLGSLPLARWTRYG